MTEDLKPPEAQGNRNCGTIEIGTFTVNGFSDDGRSAMRKLITTNLITTVAVLILLGGSVAVAQNTGRMGNSTNSGAPRTSPNTGGPIEAPIGHRQPRVGDVPSEDSASKLDAEDAALDRKIKSICRGC
jgi:hypothetical protein